MFHHNLHNHNQIEKKKKSEGKEKKLKVINFAACSLASFEGQLHLLTTEDNLHKIVIYKCSISWAHAVGWRWLHKKPRIKFNWQYTSFKRRWILQSVFEGSQSCVLGKELVRFLQSELSGELVVIKFPCLLCPCFLHICPLLFLFLPGAGAIWSLYHKQLSDLGLHSF